MRPRLSDLVHARRRAAFARQGGFALMAVLAVIAVTSVVIVALLGLMFTTLRVTEASREAGRELRALDGAMDAAINQMRFDPAASGSDACGVEPPVQRVEEMTFDQATGSTSDDVTVEVTCDGIVNGDANSAADQVRLVGKQGYSGAFPWTTDCATGNLGPNCWPWTAATGSVPAGLAGSAPNLVHAGRSPLRFDSGVTVRNGAAGLRNPTAGFPAVVSTGEYLQGSAGINSVAGQPCGMLDGTGPTAAGQVQDLNGTGAPECDSAAARSVEANPTDAIAGFSKPTTPFPESQIPFSCPNVGVGGTWTATSPATVLIQPGWYTASATARLNRVLNHTAASPLGTCRPGNPGKVKRLTVQFLPGTYYFEGPELVLDAPDAYFVMGAPKGWSTTGAAVNGSINGGVVGTAAANNPQAPLCDTAQSGATFVLSPQTSIKHRSGRLAMCPAFSPVAGQPSLPAIYQETSVPNGITVAGAQTSRTLNCDAGTQGNKDVLEFGGIGQTARYGGLPNVPSGQCRNGRTHSVTLSAQNPKALTSARVLVTGYENKTTPSNLITDRRTMVSVFGADNKRICTTTAQSGLANGQWANSVDLLTGSCAAPRGGTTCDPRYAGDLLQPPPNPNFNYCVVEKALTNESQLHLGRLEVTQFATFAFAVPPLAQQSTIESVEVVTNATMGTFDPAGVTSTDPADRSTFSAEWQNPGNAAVDAGLATPWMPCQYLICHVSVPSGTRPTRPFVHTMTLANAAVTVPTEYTQFGIDPNLSSLRALIRIDPNHCPGEPGDTCQFPPNLLFEDLGLGIPDVNQFLKSSYFGSEVTLRFEIRLPAAEPGEADRRCVATTGFVNAAQELAIDLLDVNLATGGSSCSGLFTTFADLQGAEVQVTASVPCLRNWPGNAPWQCISTGTGASYKVFQVRPPSIRQLQLQATTDTYVGARVTSLATVNATTTDAGDSFNVLGNVWMPLTNLDVEWKGDVTEGRPLIGGDLVLNALGSRIGTTAASRATDGRYTEADRYLVCCSKQRAESRRVRLTATTGDRQLQAEVLFSDVVAAASGPAVYSPGHRVTVLDWQTCGDGRCDPDPPGG